MSNGPLPVCITVKNENTYSMIACLARSVINRNVRITECPPPIFRMSILSRVHCTYELSLVTGSVQNLEATVVVQSAMAGKAAQFPTPRMLQLQMVVNKPVV